MDAASKLLRIVSQQRRMAALAYGQAMSQKEKLERELQKKQTAIARSEEHLMVVMQRSNSNSPDAIEPAQTMQALSFHQREIAQLKSDVEITHQEFANTESQIQQLRENYEAFHSKEEALQKLIEKNQQKRRAKRMKIEQTQLDEVTVQRWESQKV